MSDYLRRPIVDELMTQLTLSGDEWDGLCKALPDLDCKLRLLQRASDDMGQRFDAEDREHQVEGDKLAQAYEDQVARGVENPRYRYIWEPERRIYPEELEFLKSYTDLVVEGLGLRESEPGYGETEETPGSGSPAVTPRVDSQPVGKDSPGSELAIRPETPAARALAAAYALPREGKPVSLRAACERAGVDRANLKLNYPEAADAIRRMAAPDRTPRRGGRNRRIGDIEAVDDSPTHLSHPAE
jgi:hypothetical protein